MPRFYTGGSRALNRGFWRRPASFSCVPAHAYFRYRGLFPCTLRADSNRRSLEQSTMEGARVRSLRRLSIRGLQSDCKKLAAGSIYAVVAASARRYNSAGAELPVLEIQGALGTWITNCAKNVKT